MQAYIDERPDAASGAPKLIPIERHREGVRYGRALKTVDPRSLVFLLLASDQHVEARAILAGKSWHLWSAF